MLDITGFLSGETLENLTDPNARFFAHFSSYKPSQTQRRSPALLVPTKMRFNDFVAVPPSTPFSKDFFRALTFNSVSNVQLPRIVKASSVLVWLHVETAPEGPDALVICEGDVVPHIDDLHEILSSMEVQYSSGCRGVFFKLLVDGREVSFASHFGKVRLFPYHALCLVFNGIFRSAFTKSSTIITLRLSTQRLCSPGFELSARFPFTPSTFLPRMAFSTPSRASKALGFRCGSLDIC